MRWHRYCVAHTLTGRYVFKEAMTKVLDFIRENIRFLFAVCANLVALVVAIIWAVDSNWQTGAPLEMEPIVTSIALFATLLGLNFVNDKLTKPHIKVTLSISYAEHPIHGPMNGINIRLENHSVIKTFIKNFQAQLPESKQVLQFMWDGFTEARISNVTLEPGEAFSFNIVKKNFGASSRVVEKYGDFVVTTETGYQFVVPAKIFKEHLEILFS